MLDAKRAFEPTSFWVMDHLTITLRSQRLTLLALLKIKLNLICDLDTIFFPFLENWNRSDTTEQ